MNPKCQHDGFVAREIEGDFRFVCRECGERFSRHPKAPLQPTHVEMTMGSPGFRKTAEDFRNGVITFGNALEQTQLSVSQFTEAIQAMFPPLIEKEELEHWTIGNLTPERVTIYEKEITRTTPYEDIETIFPTEHLSNFELVHIWEKAFPDMTGVRWHNELTHDLMVFTFEFIDGTRQRVEIPHSELK